ncbi:hypothetical protein [uncultured Sphingomonas sp.]|uniref:hypothetical protein n=1 Tax=uncultured Sphingomonas sp. TaxID=158754 RepID=UPI0037487505
MAVDPEKYSARLQAAADRLCSGLPDKVKVRLDDKRQIRLTCRTWSAAMTRVTFRDAIPLAKARQRIPIGTTGTSRRALLMMKALIGDGLAVQADRHATAAALGLTVGRRRADLNPTRVLIDRYQKAVLLADGIDLHAVISEMGKARQWWGYMRNPAERVHLDVLEPQVAMLTIEQKGLRSPVLSAWQQLSRHAFYDGETLDLDIPVPQVVAVAAAGRRLGEIVATGSPILDERRIVHVTTKLPHASNQRDWTVTKITLEPDLVEVGPMRTG